MLLPYSAIKVIVSCQLFNYSREIKFDKFLKYKYSFKNPSFHHNKILAYPFRNVFADLHSQLWQSKFKILHSISSTLLLSMRKNIYFLEIKSQLDLYPKILDFFVKISNYHKFLKKK